jgi:DNA-binding transcriptional ArsR family regulator
MAFSKKHLFPLDDQLLSEYCKALGYPARPDILRTLHQKGKLTVGELHQRYPISEETFSDHLLILRKANLVEFEERHPYTFYSIHEKNLEHAFMVINAFLSTFKK